MYQNGGFMPGKSAKDPKRRPVRTVLVIDSKYNTQVRSMNRGFPNKGENMSKVPPSNYRVENDI
jgi:hypothetical protein